MLPVTNTLQTIADLQGLLLDAVKLEKDAKAGVLHFPAVLAGVLSIGGDIKALTAEAPQALPELKDLDANEAGQLAEASFGLVKAVLSALSV